MQGHRDTELHGMWRKLGLYLQWPRHRVGLGFDYHRDRFLVETGGDCEGTTYL